MPCSIRLPLPIKYVSCCVTVRVESPRLQERVWMARNFEFVLHFVRCDTVTVLSNQIIIILFSD